jgi:hypothetical protein
MSVMGFLRKKKSDCRNKRVSWLRKAGVGIAGWITPSLFGRYSPAKSIWEEQLFAAYYHGKTPGYAGETAEV